MILDEAYHNILRIHTELYTSAMGVEPARSDDIRNFLGPSTWLHQQEELSELTVGAITSLTTARAWHARFFILVEHFSKFSPHVSALCRSVELTMWTFAVLTNQKSRRKSHRRNTSESATTKLALSTALYTVLVRLSKYFLGYTGSGAYKVRE
jgi:hypothetical protein